MKPTTTTNTTQEQIMNKPTTASAPDERAYAYDPPVAFERTGNPMDDYVNRIRALNGASPITKPNVKLGQKLYGGMGWRR